MEVGISSFFIPFSKVDRWSLFRFVVITYDSRYNSDYIMADDMFLLVISFIRG